MTVGVLALVGTRKGLFLLRGDDDRRGWRVEGPLLDGWGVYHATVDARDGAFYAATNHIVYGPTVQRSADGGETWEGVYGARKRGLERITAPAQRCVYYAHGESEHYATRRPA